MWDDAAKWLAKFPELVLTALGPDGYPVSVRQTAPRYDPIAGQFPVDWPPGLEISEGPASVLCHYHDEELWNMTAIQIKGRLERRGRSWIFISAEFRPPPRSRLVSLWNFSKTSRRNGRRYLDKRGLKRLDINWDAIEELHRRARHSQR